MGLKCFSHIVRWNWISIIDLLGFIFIYVYLLYIETFDFYECSSLSKKINSIKEIN